MIKANELRIGNLVDELGIDYIEDHPVPDYNDRTPIIVDLVVLNNIENHDGTINMPCYDPIPLTPEILEKAGFESVRWSMGSYNWVHRESKICFKRLKTQGDVVRFMAHNRITHVTSLHQLQNLYFALTGEELNINL